MKMVNQALNVLKMAFTYLFDHEYIHTEFREKVHESYTCEQITELED